MAKKPKQSKSFVHPATLHIYTDGSFRPPDSASCAYAIFSEKTKHIVDMKRFAFRGRSINQMELMAVNLALDTPNSDYIIVYSDSQYTIGCLTFWWKNWEKNGWKTPQGEPVKNVELIKEILEKLKRKRFYKFVKVAAHSGDILNSVADYLATTLSKKMVEDPSITEGPVA